jgi:hypothetical protein
MSEPIPSPRPRGERGGKLVGELPNREARAARLDKAESPRIRPDNIRQDYVRGTCRFATSDPNAWGEHLATAKAGAVNVHDLPVPERLHVASPNRRIRH